jgi:hypothetical protein
MDLATAIYIIPRAKGKPIIKYDPMNQIFLTIVCFRAGKQEI